MRPYKHVREGFRWAWCTKDGLTVHVDRNHKAAVFRGNRKIGMWWITVPIVDITLLSELDAARKAAFCALDVANEKMKDE